MGSCSEHAHSLYASFRRLIKGQPSSGDETKSSYGSTVNLTQENASSSRTLSSDYTELMGGSVPCPSCKGSGRIPKEMEETLVALIPVNDDRLKPKRTWAYVLCGILVCILLAGGAIFLMVPRAVDLSSVRPPIEIINVFDHDADHISFYFLRRNARRNGSRNKNKANGSDLTAASYASCFDYLLPEVTEHHNAKYNMPNAINISNANYYSVRVVNSSATIISKFQPWSSDVVGEGGNASSTMVGPRSRNKHLLEFNNTVTLKGGVAEYCQAPFSRLTSLYVNMQFDISVTLEYLSHREQATISTVQQVCCVPSGNCTST